MITAATRNAGSRFLSSRLAGGLGDGEGLHVSSHIDAAPRGAARQSRPVSVVSVDRIAAIEARQNHEHPLLWVLGAAAVGIVLDHWVAIPVLVWCLFEAAFLLLYYRASARGLLRGQSSLAQPPGKQSGWHSALLLLGSVAALGGLWHHHCWALYPADEIVRFTRDVPIPVVARVVVLDAPRHGVAAREGPMSTMTRGETTRFPVRVVAVRQALAWHSASGQAVLIVEGRLTARDALRGDQLEVAALLARVRPALNPGEPDFAGMCRNRRRNVVLLCAHADCVRQARRAGPWSLLRQLGRLRLSAEAALDRHVGARSPLAAALLLGSRARLDQETVQAFFVSGTLHLLAISGLHVGILATFFWLLVRLHWLPRNRVLWATCLLVVSYALLTGARPPVVRATILIVVYCLARGLGRTPQAWNSLAAAGLIAIGVRPAGLFDTGTQLSFLAVASLIAAWPLFAGKRQRDPIGELIVQSRPWWIRALRAMGIRFGQLLLVSTIVWFVSLPLVAYRFHLVASIGLVLNVLLWLPLAAALFTALLTILTAPLPILPDFFGSVCGMILNGIEWLTFQAAEIPHGHSWVVGPSWWWVAVFYGGLMVRQFTPITLARRWWWALLCGWLMVGILGGSSSTRVWRHATAQPLRLSFIAVGHGTSVLVELPDGKVLLYDAGRMGSPRAAAMPIASVLWSRRIHHIDALVLSHADADHFNAVPDLLERFSVGIIYVSPMMFRRSAPALGALHAAIDDAGVPVGHLYENEQLASQGGVVVQVVHPPPGGCGRGADGGGAHGGDNENSILLLLECGRHRILLTGDIEGQGLDELLAEMPIACAVLMAPHHGSRHSRPAAIVGWADPQVVIISAGAGLPIRQVGPAYARDGASVLWTHRDGMIEVVTDGQQLRVSTWRSPYGEVLLVD